MMILMFSLCAKQWSTEYRFNGKRVKINHIYHIYYTITLIMYVESTSGLEANSMQIIQNEHKEKKQQKKR